jgi:hypothetical protein
VGFHSKITLVSGKPTNPRPGAVFAQRGARIPSRDKRFMCRLMAAAFLRFRSCVGFS